MRRNRIDHVAKLSLAPAGNFRTLLNFLESLLQLGFGLPLFGDIYRSSDKFHQFTRLVQDRMADREDVSDRPIRENNTVGGVVIGLVELGSSKTFLNCRSIFRMNPVKKEMSRPYVLIGLDTVYSFHFRRERHHSGRRVVRPTAHMQQSLAFKQICFAAFNSPFCFFTLGNVSINVVDTYLLEAKRNTLSHNGNVKANTAF